MRLVAIYIPINSLPHVFGKDHRGQTANLGGEFVYTFIEKEHSIDINRSPNNKFINDFWGKNLSNVTAIVGRNGVGKTSILRAMNHEIDPRHKNFVYIYEKLDDSSSFSIFNKTQKKISDRLPFTSLDYNPFETQYFSPVLDYELKDSFSSIALIKYFDNSFEEYYLNSLMRNIFLLNDPILKSLKEVYNDFPSYDKYIIRAKKYRKSYFTRLYADANFANPNTGDVLKIYLESDLQKLKDKTDSFTINRENLIDMYENHIKMLERESFNTLFRKIWNLEEYKYNDDQDNIHDASSLIKNFEINILSYLILDAIFPQTGLGGSFDFNEILNESEFIPRLNKLLELFLVNEYEILYNKIKSDCGTIDISYTKKMIDIINNDKFIGSNGVDIKNVRERMKNDIDKFLNIKEFYIFLISLTNNENIKIVDGNIEFDIVKNDITIFNDLVNKYKKLLETFKGSPIQVNILDIIPNKQLSTGEKAIIDFYASLNNYIEKNRFNEHINYENYLLLLDEPELGYHPIWKKKFVQAIVKTLPILFSKISPKILDKNSNTYVESEKKVPTIQIIFSTHDPLTLSDMPQNNIVYLNYNSDSSYITDEPRKSFAANITDLLADSFFIEEGLIGDFAKEKINHTISWLQDLDDKVSSKYHKKIIENIDEPIIKRKLAEMFSEKMHDTLAKDILKKEIESLQQRYNKM